jgi:carboxymethylenebutenolidase
MSRKDVSIPTPEGAVRAFAFTPDKGEGPWPATILFMDGLGIRPALFGMAQRLADAGYYVLLPDMYWRLGDYDPIDPTNPTERDRLFNVLLPSTDAEKANRDTGVFLDWLAAQPEALADKVGVTGYCLGGSITLRAAGAYPDRIVAAGSFHPGIDTNRPDSPHHVAGKIRAEVLVAGGDEDPFFTQESFEALRYALRAAGVQGEITIYRGALHGFAPPDMPSFSQEAGTALARIAGAVRPHPEAAGLGMSMQEYAR